ncbi:hypothetical protein JYU12_00825 [bacterium AH-315-K03]|nr:hypothetical protein [bacterium AH-315-K03]
MRELIELFIHLTCTVFTLLKPGGMKSLVAENLALKQQLIVVNRSRHRTPKLKTSDRFFFAFIHFFVSHRRMRKIAVILQPATILRFHKALVKKKYSRLYSKKK